ncbi:two-component response regulator-like APRR2 isoform X1 [Morus notabilis]|uniref:two-component response regulator-like APRR2 isoform X1 n=1 Tax=Morus notabilis TaxID=981085 RepID=UPI000CECFFD0|nr:two-component response regulator-like APRR2 isoform X1 [Morus notabilis]XP_024026472.1 two-component response regulator-like APRR2 isoform X1 [Morus notabilis]XP_024026473.1 two-component response regulator-like APRR2 isoform X1 [Morus notabilis]
MVCTANDLQEWKDFPKGLRVLVLDEDRNSASEIRSMLETMDYIVSTFCNETEALSAFSSKPESFHLAIVEVNTSNGNGTFKFLETAKELPIIMTSNIQCLSTMMKCIALGAVEFLRKPLSEDKLRNIWQHVVHKAFNAGGGVLSEPLKPVKESPAFMLHVDMENGDPDKKILNERENSSEIQENDHEQSTGSDKYPAPSTPQLKQGARLLDDGDCQDHTNCSPEKESGEQDGESKSVETTLGDSVAEATLLVDQPEMPSKLIVKEEEESVDGTKNESNMSSKLKHGDSQRKVNGSAENPTKASGLNNSSLSKSNRKKMKVDWTPELHKKFVQAVEQLGVDQAIPSRILELMKVEGLTRHNVASHLQKYRMHKRHILPKEDDRRWPRPPDTVQRNYYPQQPIMAYPSYHSNHAVPVPPVYPMWGQPGSHPTGVQVWGPPAYPPWQPAESWHWKPYPGMNADAWGCPVMPPPHGPYASYPQNASGFHNVGVFDNGCNTPHNSFDLYPAEEVIDKVVKEAINKPWLPLPLGLKPPSADSVLSELSRQGISKIPPNLNGSNSICKGTGSNHG